MAATSARAPTGPSASSRRMPLRSASGSPTRPGSAAAAFASHRDLERSAAPRHDTRCPPGVDASLAFGHAQVSPRRPSHPPPSAARALRHPRASATHRATPRSESVVRSDEPGGGPRQAGGVEESESACRIDHGRRAGITARLTKSQAGTTGLAAGLGRRPVSAAAYARRVRVTKQAIDERAPASASSLPALARPAAARVDSTWGTVTTLAKGTNTCDGLATCAELPLLARKLSLECVLRSHGCVEDRALRTRSPGLWSLTTTLHAHLRTPLLATATLRTHRPPPPSSLSPFCRQMRRSGRQTKLRAHEHGPCSYKACERLRAVAQRCTSRLGELSCCT